MKTNFLEEHKIINCGSSAFIAANEDIFNGSPATDVINMENWRQATFVVQKGAGAAGTATFTVESCDDVVPTTTTAIAFVERHCTSGDTFSAWAAVAATGLLSTAGADQIYEISVSAEDLSGTDHFVRLKCTEGDSTAVDGGILCILTGPRYAEDVVATAIV